LLIITPSLEICLPLMSVCTLREPCHGSRSSRCHASALANNVT
jgi:hypothetical protein